VACAGNSDNLLGNDVHYTFTLEKHCDLWPTLQINTNNSDFDVVTKVEYWGINNAWNILNQNSTNIWNWDNDDFGNEGNLPTGTAANFRIQIDANNTNETGNFKLEIAAIKQSNADPMVCMADFTSCCRIAVDTGSYIPNELVKELPKSIDFKLIPNPANEQVAIYFNYDLAEKAQIELLDGLGKVHKKSIVVDKESIIDLRTIPAGIYTLRVSCHGKQKTKKLVLVK
jgi:hypothetical protein